MEQYKATVSTFRGGWVGIEAEPSPKPADTPPAYSYGAFGNYEPTVASITVQSDTLGDGLGIALGDGLGIVNAPADVKVTLRLTRAQLKELAEVAHRALTFDAFVKGMP